MRVGQRVAILAALIFLVVGTTEISAQMKNFNKTFKTSSGSLYVKLDQGDITIRTGEHEVTVDVYGIDQSELGNLDVRESGGDVYVEFDVDGRSYSEIKVEIGIPEGLNIDLTTAGGDINVNGRLSGMATVKTAGGDIEMGDVDGVAEIKTAGGDIEVGALGSDAWMKTAGGDIKADSVDGKAEVVTSGGDIVIGNVSAALEATTAGGDIELGSVGGKAYIKTAGGDIEVGEVKGSAELRTAGGDVVLEGASGEVIAKTAGGDLELRNVSGTLQAETAGGDIEAELTPGTGSGSSSLETAGGDIRLYLPSTANVNIDATIRISGRWERESQKYGIYSDFKGVQMQKNASAKEIRAKSSFGSGGQVITLETVNGNIYIKTLPR